jgi:hypothetical protein
MCCLLLLWIFFVLDYLQMGFFGTIFLARCLLALMQPLRMYALEELFVVWAKCVLATFTLRLYNPTDDVWFLALWIPNFLFRNYYRVRRKYLKCLFVLEINYWHLYCNFVIGRT